MHFGPHLLLAALEGLVTSAVLALTALGLSLVFGVMRVVNVAHGEFFMLGAVLAWAITTVIGGHPALGFLAALVIAPLIVGAIALIAEQLVLRRLNYNPEARPVEPPFSYRILLPWFGYSGYKLSIIAASALLLVATWLVLTRTKIGLIMRATQYDSETAQAFGIPVDRVYAGVFALGAMLAAVAAVLIVPISQAHYLMGQDPLLLSFIVVIIGGLGSLRGTVVAAVLIGLSDGIISVFFSPTLAKIIATLLVAMVLVFRPQGLFGTASR
jgi:branched-chain amino acid transport system permease protein